jgi:hypothetical protein
MTIKQLYGIIDDMRKIYDFEDDETHITNMLDMPSESMNCLEITTFDAATGVQITMQKGAERE